MIKPQNKIFHFIEVCGLHRETLAVTGEFITCSKLHQEVVFSSLKQKGKKSFGIGILIEDSRFY